jgi:beta-mannosidase
VGTGHGRAEKPLPAAVGRTMTITSAPARHAALSAADNGRSLPDWFLARTPPGECATPANLIHAAVDWIPAPVPGTVAQTLRAAGAWSLESPEDLDASDWWYRCQFTGPQSRTDARASLCFKGLATLAEVWLNGEPLLTTDNMFREYRADIGDAYFETNELIICFRSLSAALAKRRPRPRWKTRLVSHQQLRWIRTTLLGRIPGWSPGPAPVGPWRPVLLEEINPETITGVQHRAFLDGHDGVLEVSCDVSSPGDIEISGEVSIDGSSSGLAVERRIDGYRLSGRVRVSSPRLWWPHTHGDPNLYGWQLRIAIGDRLTEYEGEAVGFRDLAAGSLSDSFGVRINGIPIFCRGACWTCGDIVSLTPSADDLRRDLTRMRDAGANMIRVGGTMVYETDAFYRLCDELGLLVWQDFMFANMDYPADDEPFLQSVMAEAAQQLQRLSAHPSIAVYCGNSEVEQQSAMFGMPKDLWRSRLFSEVLPGLCARWHPEAAYVPATPCEGALPFHTAEGLAHYYGVGAYLRPLSDVRQADVKFTPECLGFANVPEPAVVDALMQGDLPATHDPRWKRRTPRDTGAGWDFEDVRDHYLRLLFGLDPLRLRMSDSKRYLDVSRVTTGEVMSRVYAEWRSAHSHCQGALVWFLKDLWPGAGWGVLDSGGGPKACYHYLRRAWRPQVVTITEEGLNGLALHVINESSRQLTATLSLVLLRDGHVITARADRPCVVKARGRSTFGADELLGRFYDPAYAYRFGPLPHTVVAATLSGEAGEVISEAFWFPDGGEVLRPRPASVTAVARPSGSHGHRLVVRSDEFLYAVHLEIPGFVFDDDYFCLMPGRDKIVCCEPETGTRPTFGGYVHALNLNEPVRIDSRDA